MPQPIVIVSTCTKQLSTNPYPYFGAQVKYIDAVLRGADCMPLMLPALGTDTDIEAVLSIANGIMLTGSPSNVHPRHFGQAIYDASLPLDAARDATTLPLIQAAVRRRIPVLAICRGFQEVNVALGGSLHQAVHVVPGRMDHRENLEDAVEIQYGPRHPVQIVPGGLLEAIMGSLDEFQVNSLHGQGVDTLAPGLKAEAWAPDGQLESFSLASGESFLLGVQWHPEYQLLSNPASVKLFAAFGQACADYKASEKRGLS